MFNDFMWGLNFFASKAPISTDASSTYFYSEVQEPSVGELECLCRSHLGMKSDTFLGVRKV